MSNGTSSHGGIEQLEKDKPRGKCRKWRLWVRHNGRKRSRRFTGTYRQAQCALEDFRAEINSEVPESETFAAYAASWLAYRRDSGRYAPMTLRNDEGLVRALSARLGTSALNAITPEECRKALADIRRGVDGTGIKSSTLVNVHSCLNKIMQQAEDDGLIAASPMRHVKPPKKNVAERKALSPEEIALLLNRLDELPLDGYVMAIYLIVCLGLRRGEACALMDEDVYAGLVRIRHSVKDRGNTIGDPKSVAGIRVIPMPPRLEEKVERWRIVRDALGIGDAPTLACTRTGGIIRVDALYKRWRTMSKQVGCEEFTLHELRHSNLSMIARHMSPFDLQRYAGWSSIAMAKTYVHDDMQSVIAGVMEAWERPRGDWRHRNATSPDMQGHADDAMSTGLPAGFPDIGI